MLHIVLGVAFSIAFCWPFLAFEQPVVTWAYLYLVWAVAIVVIFVLQRYSRAEPSGFADPLWASSVEQARQAEAGKTSDV